MAEKASAEKKSKRGRSPSYPGIDLGRALELTRTVYDLTKRHAVAIEAVLQAWSLKPKSSQGLVTIAALKKFGLLEALPQRGPDSGKVKLSELVLNILLDEREDSQERVDRVRTAALTPKIHAALWKHYEGDLPTDQALRFLLLTDFKFTEFGADEFIGQLRRTIAFAGLEPGNVQSAGNNDKFEPDEEAQMTPPSTAPVAKKQFPSGLREVPIPIPGSAWPLLKAGFPLTEEEWQQMLDVLMAMKPGLVQAKRDN